MTFEQIIRSIVTFCTLVYIGFCLRVMDKPKLFKILTAILGILIIGYGMFMLIQILPAIIYQLNHPIDREILGMYEVQEIEKTRRHNIGGLWAKLIFIGVGVFDLILAVKIDRIKHEEVKLWIKLPVIFQLGIIFIILLLSLILTKPIL